MSFPMLSRNTLTATVLILLVAVLSSSASAGPNGTYFGTNQNGVDYEALFIMESTDYDLYAVRVVFLTNPASEYPGKPDIFVDGVVPIESGEKDEWVFRNIPDQTRGMGFFDLTAQYLGGDKFEVTVTGSGSRCGKVDFKGIMRHVLWTD